MITTISTIFITIIFFLAGFNKIMNFNGTAKSIQGKIPVKLLPFSIYQLITIFVILLEIVAPLVIVYSTMVQDNDMKDYAQWSSLALAGFTILATLLYHFPPVGNQYFKFMSNLALTGALLLLAHLFYNRMI